ncbi:MAG: NAD(P)H-binding protein, partial [Chitinophagaceae bacterium]|nr:NAD(P)H-binding protein [Chitinophagaceae bacterium]
MNVIITGATGMIGKGLLLECLDDQRVGSILLVTRNPVGVVHEKIKEVILKDFNNPESISNELAGYDAVFFCLGVSAGG